MPIFSQSHTHYPYHSLTHSLTLPLLLNLPQFPKSHEKKTKKNQLRPTSTPISAHKQKQIKAVQYRCIGRGEEKARAKPPPPSFRFRGYRRSREKSKPSASAKNIIIMCYVGKATKIFIFMVTVLLVTGLVLGLGILRRRHHNTTNKYCSSDGSCISSPFTFPPPNLNIPTPPSPIDPNPITPPPPASTTAPITTTLPPPTPVTNPITPPSPSSPPPSSPPPPPPDSNPVPPPPLLPPPPSDTTTPNPPSVAAPPTGTPTPGGSTLVAPGPVHAFSIHVIADRH